MAEETSELRLVRRASQGDEAAFEVLYARYHRRIYEYVWRMTHSSSASEEVVQDCFLAFFRMAARYDADRARVLTLLLTIARNHVISRLRRPVEPGENGEVVSASPSAEQHLLREERAMAVHRAVARLPESQREVLILFEFEELSLKEIGAILDLDTGAVKSRLFRARESLKQWLAPLVTETTKHD